MFSPCNKIYLALASFTPIYIKPCSQCCKLRCLSRQTSLRGISCEDNHWEKTHERLHLVLVPCSGCKCQTQWCRGRRSGCRARRSWRGCRWFGNPRDTKLPKNMILKWKMQPLDIYFQNLDIVSKFSLYICSTSALVYSCVMVCTSHILQCRYSQLSDLQLMVTVTRLGIM